MSSGHHHRGMALSTKELESMLSNPKVEAELARDFTIDTTYEIPFTGGYSKDGKTRYIDCDLHAPGKPVGTIEIDGKLVNVLPFLVGDPKAKDPVARGGHEGIEKAIEDALGKTYDYAHEVATGGERRLVMAAGLNWTTYSKALEPYLKADEGQESYERVPADLDESPYLQKPVNKALLEKLRAGMGRDDGQDGKAKLTKAEVKYSDGMAKSHCGPVRKWPTGDCEYYQGNHACALVKGYIAAEGWCTKWATK